MDLTEFAKKHNAELMDCSGINSAGVEGTVYSTSTGNEYGVVIALHGVVMFNYTGFDSYESAEKALIESINNLSGAKA